MLKVLLFLIPIIKHLILAHLHLDYQFLLDFLPVFSRYKVLQQLHNKHF